MQVADATAAPVKPAKKKRSLGTKLRHAWRAVRREQATPKRLGVAMAVGVFLGAGPFYGLQTILCLVSATVFRLNKFTVLLGLQVSSPPFTPFVILAGVQLGYRVLYGDWAPLSLQMVIDTPVRELASRFAVSYLIGGNLLGLITGGLAGWATMSLVRRRREADERDPPLRDEEIDELHEKLPALPRFYRHYAAWKVRLDPLYLLVLPLLAGRTRVVDLGAGMGLMGFLLRLRSPATRVHCVEWDQEKAQMAQRLNAGDELVTVAAADARTAELGQADAICLFDVLHYNPLDEQRAWLQRVAQTLPAGGLLLVRELDVEKARWRMSERIEQQAVKRGWNQGAGVVAWPLSDMRALLEQLGFEVTMRPAGQGLFSANALVVARKR